MDASHTFSRHLRGLTLCTLASVMAGVNGLLMWNNRYRLMMYARRTGHCEYGSHGPAYYNALAGGPPGAAIRMPRNFWGWHGELPAINDRAGKRGLVFWHKVTRWGFDRYKKDSPVRPDIQYTGDWTAEYSDWPCITTSVKNYQRNWISGELTEPIGPSMVSSLMAQIMSVYERPGRD